MTANRKFTGWFLMLTLLIATVFPNSAIAASGDVVSIDIEGSGTTVELTVGKTKQLKVWGTVEGSSVKRDLTNAVTWTSSDSGTIKVTNGFLTALKSGTVTIRADYNSATSSIEVKAKDSYKELTLEYPNQGKFKLGDTTDLAVKALAQVEGSAGATKDVTQEADWSSSNSQILTVEKGKITLVGEGKATVTAKYNGLTADFKAEVGSLFSDLKLSYIADGQTLPADDIEMVVGDSEIALKADTTVSSDQSKSDVTDKVTWTSSDSSVATVDGGKLKIVSVGKTTITAQYLGMKAQANVYVRTPFEAIKLTPSTDQILFIGERLQAKAEMRSSANATEDITSKATWTSSDLMNATVSGGTITAKAQGGSSIKVSHLGINKTLKLKIYPTLTKLTAAKTELELFKGESASLPKVTGLKLDDEEMDISQEVKWTSSNEDVAKIEDGKVVAKGKGTATLRAELPKLDDSSASPIRSASVTVTLNVKEKVLALVTDVEKLSVVMGEETPLPQLSAVWEDGEEAALTDTIEWSLTGSNAVIKSGSAGKTIKGLTKGSATLKGTYSNKTISIPVTIEPKIVKVVVDPVNIQLNVKKSKSIKVTGFYQNGKSVNLSSKVGWESDNTNVATITTTSVKAIAEGTATLKGSYQGHSVSVRVSVIPKLLKLTVDEKSLKLAPGSAKTVVVTAEYDNGNNPTVTGSATWTSSKPSVAKVTAGRIEAVAKGSATIKGVYGGKSVSIRVSVK